MLADELSYLPLTTWKVSKYGVISSPYFPVFRLNTGIYGVNLRIQSEYRKIRTRNNSVLGHFSRSDCICEWKCLPSRWPHHWGWYYGPHKLKESGCVVCPWQYWDQVASLYIQDASEWVLGELLQQEPKGLWLYCCLRWTIQSESQIAFPPQACCWWTIWYISDLGSWFWNP